MCNDIIKTAEIIEVIKKARKYLEEITPVKSDCGLLCGSRCCKKPDLSDFTGSNNSDDFGMWLFPGEDELYKNNGNFKIINADGNNSYPFLACLYSGTKSDFCQRQERPLFCRFFPYFPLIRQIKRRGVNKYRIKLIIHPAALRICPVSKLKLRMTSDFSRAVKKSVYIMLNQKSMYGMYGDKLKKYLTDTGEYLNSMSKFAYRIYKK